MELTLWTYEGPPHVGAMRIASSMKDIHYVLHAPQGDTYLSIPSGSLPEQKLRLQGHGLHNLDTQGDLFFTLKLKLPETWSDEELRLLEKLRSVRIDEPRSSWFDQART